MKPNPLTHQQADAVVPPAFSGSEGVERSRRGSLQDQAVAIDRRTSPEPPPTPLASKRVDTGALTGLRGLAAMHVACGHIFMQSDLRADLIGGAAMPFFFLLSGFVMTLGYGQTLYEAPPMLCCANGANGANGSGTNKLMDKPKFWRNRFARLFPVYAFTNLLMAGLIAPMGGMGVADGTSQGRLGLGLQFSLSIFGLNTWFYPIADVGMPPNGVTWTICTMSFFYMVFPYILPRMQKMSTVSRSAWIINFFWLQFITYAALYGAYAFAVPTVQFNPEDFNDPFGAWRVRSQTSTVPVLYFYEPVLFSVYHTSICYTI